MKDCTQKIGVDMEALVFKVMKQNAIEAMD